MKSPKMMYGYAAFLIVCALVAFAWSGFEQVTALIPAGMGLVMAAMGWLASMIERNQVAGMIGIHVGLVLPLLYALMFGWLGFSRARDDDPAVYLVTIFTIMFIGSIAAFIAILLTRPKPEQRGG